MARILAISSQVARGHVGLSAAIPALQALGHEVIGLPTVLLSNHPGHTRFAGKRIEPQLLGEMLDAIEANGWLGDIDAVLTGYLPSVAHVDFAEAALHRVWAARPDAVHICDPVLGDTPKGLYIDRAAADVVARALVPFASIATPNAFELGFIAEADSGSLWQAEIALASSKCPHVVIAKSVAADSAGELINLAAIGGRIVAMARVGRRASAPNGTGDLMAALIAAATLEGHEPAAAMALATAILDRVLDASAGRDELDLRVLPRRLADVVPWPLDQR